jgi:hypothetical protein
MRREPTDSSTLSSVGYAVDTATLEIEFRSGKVYRYFMVPAPLYDALLKAESKGAFFNRSIKNVYSFTRG